MTNYNQQINKSESNTYSRYQSRFYVNTHKISVRF